MRHRLFKEPLVHFAVLGVVLFGVYHWQEAGRPAEVSPADKRIVIDQQEFDHLKALWKIQWKREPSPGDIQALIDRHLRQEVFYREALRMNLDHNDEIIKRRLSQKMEAVAKDLGTLTRPPTDEQLREYFQSHTNFFTLPRSYAFRQVLFLADETDRESQMQATLESLRTGADIPTRRLNTAAVACDWPMTSINDIDNAFGGDFTRALDELPVEQWSGPIRSGYGWHLVFIRAKQAPTLPNFAAVRDFVAREYDYQAELESQDRLYRELLGKYEVSITASEIPPEVRTNFVTP